MLLFGLILAIIILLVILLMIIAAERRSKKEDSPRAQIEKYWDGSERRTQVRLGADLTANYNIRKHPVSRNGGRVTDISETGLRLLVDKKLAAGSILAVEVSIPGNPRPIEIESEVVWCNEAKDKEVSSGKRFFHIGVRILSVRGGSRALFEHFMRSLEEGLIKKKS